MKSPCFFDCIQIAGPGNQKEMSCCCFWGPAAEGIGQAAVTSNHFEEKNVSLLAPFSFGDDFRNLRFSYGKPSIFHLPWIFLVFFMCNHATQHPKKVIVEFLIGGL